MTSLSSAYGNAWNQQQNFTQVLKQNDPTKYVTATPKPSVTPAPKAELPPVFWLHRDAWNYYPIVMKMLGEGDEIETCAGGLVRWNNCKGLFNMRNVFLKHELRDQNIFVRCPKPHYEFFYSFVKYTINPGNINKIVAISSSITYDPIRSELCCRSGNLGTNIALLSLAVKIDQGIYNTREMNAQGLYAKTIEQATRPIEIAGLYRELTHLVPQNTEPTNSEIQQTRFYTHNPGGGVSGFI